MTRLFGFYTQNTLKCLYTLEELGTDYDFHLVDLFKGEQRQDDFLKLNPVGKVPVLQVGDESLFESGAICRYLANAAGSDSYPADPMDRAKVDQWMDFFSVHLGHWLNTQYFENVIKVKAQMGEPNMEKCAEARKFALTQMAIVDTHLAEHTYLCGDQLTIADLFAFAYIEQVEHLDFSWNDFPHAKAWFDRIESRGSIQRGRAKVTPL
ncbi:glutathione S-transferase family protein [Paremcibacter congregatus]|uniref:Glutathione S-transferase n=1 Tax=Paremcibacter congregatus TaxID=2043170 RepID=A0A2G4YQE0_9PROT|nr:glutathione S-transferase family protein [Paremcibacter congregatus]PHZ84490.1 hypothetical protein CRD36_11840 [Paremcibacter congregatus]QDE28709.1 glutathione S-transferase family protein [Paremcibacter congregatus]